MLRAFNISIKAPGLFNLKPLSASMLLMLLLLAKQWTVHSLRRWAQACHHLRAPAGMRSKLLLCCLLAALACAAADQGRGNDDTNRPRGSKCVTDDSLSCKLGDA
jgi:hypothetical protein